MRLHNQILNNLKLKENKEEWYNLCNDAEQALFKVRSECKDETAISTIEKMILDLNSIRMEQYGALTEYSLVEETIHSNLDLDNMVDALRTNFKGVTNKDYIEKSLRFHHQNGYISKDDYKKLCKEFLDKDCDLKEEYDRLEKKDFIITIDGCQPVKYSPKDMSQEEAIKDYLDNEGVGHNREEIKFEYLDESFNPSGYTKVIDAISAGIETDEDKEALQKYLQDIINYCREIANDYEVLVEESNIKENINSNSIEYVEPCYTGGGIYVYTGKLKDGNYFITSDDFWFSSKGVDNYFPIRVVNADPSDLDESTFEGWQQEHLVRDLSEEENKDMTKQILNWIINNRPKGNYAVEDMKDLLNDITDTNLEESAEVNNPVYILCYTDIELWENKNDAIHYYLEGIASCEGAEQNRYISIVRDLKGGEEFADDGGSEYITDFVKRSKDGKRENAINIGRLTHDQAIDYIKKINKQINKGE